MQNKRIALLSRVVAPYCHGRVLDVGCGDTLVANAIRKANPSITHITGIDIAPPKHAHVPFTQFDGKKIPFADDSFDVVICNFVLHHSTHPKTLVREMSRVGKTLVIVEDRYEHPIDWLAVQLSHIFFWCWFGWRYDIAGFHTQKQWKKILRSCGLTILTQQQMPPTIPLLYTRHVLYLVGKSNTIHTKQ